MKTPALDFSLSPSTLRDGFTQSELSTMDECPKKWNFKYNNRLDRIDAFNWNFFVGTSWHNFQENWRRGKGNYDVLKFTPPEIPKNIPRTTEFEKTLEYWTEILPTYQLEYSKFFSGEEKLSYDIIEQELTAKFLDIELRGKIDLAKFAKSIASFIRDFKSTGSAWLISPDGWHFKLQFMLYCWLMIQNFKEWKGKQFNFQLDIMQKPGLKQTQKENWIQHIERVKKDIPTRPDFYFSRSSYLITPEAIQHFEDTVLTPKIQRLKLAIDNPEEGLSIITNPNTNACNAYGHRCDFFDICEKSWSAGKFFFEQRERKHMELE